MLKKLFLFLIFAGSVFPAFSQEILSPEKFLGYKLGEQFTPHHRIVEYFRYVAQVSKNVKIVDYGTTNEGRPLLAIFIASDENIGKLENIRENNLRLAGLMSSSEEAPASANTPVICWLSYNVHGNEPASSETAMQVLFDMTDPSNAQTKTWLEKYSGRYRSLLKPRRSRTICQFL